MPELISSRKIEYDIELHYNGRFSGNQHAAIRSGVIDDLGNCYRFNGVAYPVEIRQTVEYGPNGASHIIYAKIHPSIN